MMAPFGKQVCNCFARGFAHQIVNYNEFGSRIVVKVRILRQALLELYIFCPKLRVNWLPFAIVKNDAFNFFATHTLEIGEKLFHENRFSGSTWPGNQRAKRMLPPCIHSQYCSKLQFSIKKKLAIAAAAVVAVAAAAATAGARDAHQPFCAPSAG